MPQVTAEVWVPVDPATAFAVSQTTGELRLRWDPFIRRQHLIDADAPGKGVRTYTRARVGPRMVSEYVSYRPPRPIDPNRSARQQSRPPGDASADRAPLFESGSVGMTMVEGPWFFASFGGGWRFTPERQDDVDGTRAVWKYTYSVKPAWLRPVAERIGQWLLGREIRARIAAWARACEDPVVLAAVTRD